MRRSSPIAALAVALCAACSAGGGGVLYTPLEVALRPISTRQPVPLLVWQYQPVVIIGAHELLLVAYDDGSVIFRDPHGEGYRALTDTTLVRRLYGSASDRAAFAALPEVRMPPEWHVLDGATESLCIWDGGAMRCHELDNPEGGHIGRPAREACAGLAHDTASYHGRRDWERCGLTNAVHAVLPAPFAAFYRRAYDAAVERAADAAPWAPDRVLLALMQVECEAGEQAPWPEVVPRPREGERTGRTEWGETRRLMVTVEQARRLREAVEERDTDCVGAHGVPWTWEAYFKLPNLGALWTLGG